MDEEGGGRRVLSRRQLLTGLAPGVIGLAAPLWVLAAPAEAKSNRFPKGFCTWYAAERFNAVAPEPGVTWHGNAGDWYLNALRAGWVVNASPLRPRVNAIVVWTGGLGHVAIVESIERTGIRVSEMNVGRPLLGFTDPRSPNYAKTANFGRITTTRIGFESLTPRDKRLYFRGYIYPARW